VYTSPASGAEDEPPADALPLGPVRLAVAAVRSVVAYAAVSLYVLVVGPPAILLALLAGSPRVIFLVSHAGAEMGLRLAGIRYVVEGFGHVPAGTPVIFCPNHESNLDAPVVYRALYPVRRQLLALFKAEMARLPVLGRALLLAGLIPVERENREKSMAAVDRATEALRAGRSFLIFPEGTRSHTGDLLPFKKGVFVMAIRAQAPIVPVGVRGARASMARGSLIIRPVTIHIRIGEPVETIGLVFEDRDRLIETVRAAIVRLRSAPA
jgi:1-acyl-sn-glycerol-3-phosphate acyltransferase